MTKAEKEIVKMAIAAGVQYTSTLGTVASPSDYCAVRQATPANPYARG